MGKMREYGIEKQQ